MLNFRELTSAIELESAYTLQTQCRAMGRREWLSRVIEEILDMQSGLSDIYHPLSP